MNWSSKVCTVSSCKFIGQDLLPITGSCFCRTALGSMQYHSSWVLLDSFPQESSRRSMKLMCRDLYLYAAYITWWHGVSSQEELCIWFSMKIILCILISVLETSNDQAVFVFVFWYSCVLKIDRSEAVLMDQTSWRHPTTPHLVRNMTQLWYRVSDLNFLWNLKGTIGTG